LQAQQLFPGASARAIVQICLPDIYGSHAQPPDPTLLSQLPFPAHARKLL